MFKTMRRQDRKIHSEEAIEKMLKSGEYGILSTIGESGYPYGVPVNYIYADKCIYFHCATEGQKLDNIKYNDKVSFCVVGSTEVLPDQFSTNYESVIAFGRATEVNDEEKEMALIHLIDKYSPEFEEAGMKYIRNAADKTTVMRIEVDHMTGKARV